MQGTAVEMTEWEPGTAVRRSLTTIKGTYDSDLDPGIAV